MLTCSKYFSFITSRSQCFFHKVIGELHFSVTSFCSLFVLLFRWAFVLVVNNVINFLSLKILLLFWYWFHLQLLMIILISFCMSETHMHLSRTILDHFWEDLRFLEKSSIFDPMMKIWIGMKTSLSLSTSNDI